MKAIKYLSAVALTLAMVACDDFDLPNPPGQSYPEPEGYFENSGIVLSPVAENINLVQANEANQYVTVSKITELVDFPENYTLSIDMQVAADDSFATSSTVATVIEGENVTVNPDVLNGAIQAVLTKAPGTYQVPVRFIAYAELGSTRMRLGGLDATYGTETLTVTTLDPEKVLEEAYYFVPCDAAGAPQLNKAIKMNNTAGNVSTYDNPEFALKFEVAEGQTYKFMIAPQSVVTSGDTSAIYGALASNSTSGKLGVGYGACTVELTGDVLITINVSTDAYTLSYAFESLYPFSGSVKAENVMCLYTSNYINYTGVTAINQAWTLYTAADKSGVAFKQNADVEAVVSEDGLTQTGEMATTGSTLRAPIKGNTLYYCDINLVQLTYSISAIQTLSVIGDGNGWDTATATQLTPDRYLRVWTASDVVIGSEFKINANSAWDIDFGLSEALTDANGEKVFTTVYKGGNIPVEAGTYDVEVNFSAMPYTITLKKK